MNKNGGKRIKMSLYTVGTLFRKGSLLFALYTIDVTDDNSYIR